MHHILTVRGFCFHCSHCSSIFSPVLVISFKNFFVPLLVSRLFFRSLLISYAAFQLSAQFLFNIGKWPDSLFFLSVCVPWHSVKLNFCCREAESWFWNPPQCTWSIGSLVAAETDAAVLSWISKANILRLYRWTVIIISHYFTMFVLYTG